MKRRSRVSGNKSKKIFRKGTKTHVKNINGAPMRGGIRL